MKKNLLLVAGLALTTALSAQLNNAGDGYTYNAADANSNCYYGFEPNNGGIMSHGGGFVNGPNYLVTAGLTLETSTVDSSANPVWFGLPDTTGGNCQSLDASSKQIDMSGSGNGKVTIEVEANVIDATLEVFIGADGAWYPNSSTANTDGAGAGITASVMLTAADTKQSFTLDFEALGSGVWTAWTAKNTVRSLGFRTLTPGATYVVSSVKFGTEAATSNSTAEVSATNVSVYPNPATDVLNVSFDATLNSTVELMDLTGKVVASQNVVAGNQTLSFNTVNVNAGVYFVNVRSANGNSVEKVIIK